MRVCRVCGNKTKAFRNVCKECSKYIPYEYVDDVEKARELCEENKKRAEKFVCTSHYGRLCIDSIHRMFCISPFSKKGATEYRYIYYISELTDVGLYATSISDVGYLSPKLVCDIKFYIQFIDRSYEFCIMENAPCRYTRTSDTYKAELPSDFLIFKAVFQQMISDELFEADKKLKRINQAVAKHSNNWCLGVMFFEDDDFTEEQLRKRRNELMKTFHPDLNSNGLEISAQVNEAYNTLKDNFKK